MKALEDEGGRTVDVMRFLVTCRLDHITGTVINKPCLNNVVKESVRRLLKDLVGYRTGNLDSDVPKITKFEMVAVKYDSNSQEKGHISIPLKQGDWLCPE